jgi:hypothetical protein
MVSCCLRQRETCQTMDCDLIVGLLTLHVCTTCFFRVSCIHRTELPQYLLLDLFFVSAVAKLNNYIVDLLPRDGPLTRQQ